MRKVFIGITRKGRAFVRAIFDRKREAEIENLIARLDALYNRVTQDVRGEFAADMQLMRNNLNSQLGRTADGYEIGAS